MVWKVIVDNGLAQIDEYTVCADNIDKAEEEAIRQAWEYWEDEWPMEQFRAVSVYCKVK